MLPERCAGCRNLTIADGAIRITEYTGGCLFHNKTLYRIKDVRTCPHKKLIDPILGGTQ